MVIGEDERFVNVPSADGNETAMPVCPAITGEGEFFIPIPTGDGHYHAQKCYRTTDNSIRSLNVETADGNETLVNFNVTEGVLAAVGGSTSTGAYVAGGTRVFGTAKYDGTNWSTFPEYDDADPTSYDGYNGQVWGIIEFDSKFYIYGAFTYVGGDGDIRRFAEIDLEGTELATRVGGGADYLNNTVRDAIVWDGDLYLCGDFITFGGTTLNRICKFDGTNVTALGSGFNSSAYRMVIYGGELHVVGSFTTADGNPAVKIAKWDGANWTTYGTGLQSTGVDLTVDGDNLIVSGAFTSVDGVDADRMAIYYGTESTPYWEEFGGGANNQVLCIHADPFGNVYAGGYFTEINTNGGTPVATYRFAKWNGSEWDVTNTQSKGLTATPRRFKDTSDGKVFIEGAYWYMGGLKVGGACVFDPSDDSFGKVGGSSGLVDGDWGSPEVKGYFENDGNVYMSGQLAKFAGTWTQLFNGWGCLTWDGGGTWSTPDWPDDYQPTRTPEATLGGFWCKGSLYVWMDRVQDLTESVAVLARKYWWKWTPGETEWEYTGIKSNGFNDYVILDNGCAVLLGIDAMYTGATPSFPNQSGAVHFDPEESSPLTMDYMKLGVSTHISGGCTCLVKYDDVWWALAGFFGLSNDGKDSNGDAYKNLGWYDDVVGEWFAADSDDTKFLQVPIQLKLAYGNMYALRPDTDKTSKLWKYDGASWSDIWGDVLYPTDPGGESGFPQMQSHVTGDGNLYFSKYISATGAFEVVYWNGVEAAGQFTTIANDSDITAFTNGARGLISYDGKILLLNRLHYLEKVGGDIIRTGGGCVFAWDGTDWVQPSFGVCGTDNFYARNLAIQDDPNNVPSPNGD